MVIDSWPDTAPVIGNSKRKFLASFCTTETGTVAVRLAVPPLIDSEIAFLLNPLRTFA